MKTSRGQEIASLENFIEVPGFEQWMIVRFRGAGKPFGLRWCLGGLATARKTRCEIESLWYLPRTSIGGGRYPTVEAAEADLRVLHGVRLEEALKHFANLIVAQWWDIDCLDIRLEYLRRLASFHAKNVGSYADSWGDEHSLLQERRRDPAVEHTEEHQILISQAW